MKSLEWSLHNRIVSTFSLWKQFSEKKEVRRSYQTLRTCLRPYKVLFNLKICSKKNVFSKAKSCFT